VQTPSEGLVLAVALASSAASAAVTPNDTRTRDQLCQAVSRLDDAESRGKPAELMDALMHVGRCYLAIRSYAAAEDFMRQALRPARALGMQAQAVSILTELAQATGLRALDQQAQDPSGARASRDRARDCAFEAAAMIYKQTHTSWAAPALVSVSDVLMLCGDHDDAATMRNRAASWAQTH
jgi:tetratricopeptide (TPR) repeat protein